MIRVPTVVTCLLMPFALLAIAAPDVSRAQDMRVYTSVSVVEADGSGGRPVSHSLTLFHAGKVYDYMVDLEEVVVFEPAQHRFMILGPDATATEVPHAQVLQFLESADGIARNMIEQLSQKGDAAAIRAADAIRFQLDPQFHVASDQPRRLTLSGDLLSYDLETVKIESAPLTKLYLDYADWAARLNFVLHPQALLPAARLALNDQLRQRGELPIEVTLTKNFDGVSRLRAEHTYSWQLQSADKLSISQWERSLASDQVRWVSFHEYQQHLLARSGR